MQIVIDIPERDYKYIKKLEKGITDYGVTLHLYDAVRTGTPLPKGHGRLIDADQLAKAIMRAWTLWEKKGEDCYIFADVIAPLLVSQTTIIEADKE